MYLSCNVRPNAPPYFKSHYMIFATKSTNVTPATIARVLPSKFYVYEIFVGMRTKSRVNSQK